MYLAWLDKQPDWKNAGLTTAEATARAGPGNGKPASQARQEAHRLRRIVGNASGHRSHDG